MKFIRNKYSLSILILLILIIIIDLILGKINQTDVIRKSSLNFRNEAVNLDLKTRYLIPNVSHKYSKEFYKKNNTKVRSFRTDKNGIVIGSEEFNKKSIKILFLGGSTTETNEVDEHLRFPFLAGKLISEKLQTNYNGLNLGVRGNTTQDSLNLLVNHPIVDEVSYIVLMHNINDRFFLSKKSIYSMQLNSKKPQSLTSVKVAFLNFINTAYDFLFYSSNIMFIVGQNLFDINPWTGEKIKNNILTEGEIDFEINKNHKKQFEKNLNIIHQISKSLNKKLILMTQPLGKDSIQQKVFNNLIRETALSNNILLIDLEKKMSSNSIFFLNDMIHLNNDGSKEVAKIFSEKFLSRFHKIEQSNLSKKKRPEDCSKKKVKNFSLLSEAHSLHSEHGRYPSISKNNNLLVFQQWDKNKEIIKIFDFKKKKYVKVLSSENSNNFRHPRIIDDGKDIKILFSKQKKDEEQIYIYDLKTNSENLVHNYELNSSIPFHINGKYFFAGTSKLNKKPDLYLFSKNKLLQLTNTEWEEWRPVYDDINNLIYFISDKNKNFDIFTLNINTLEQKVFYSSQMDEWDPIVSKDGNVVIFSSKEDGDWDLIIKHSKNKELKQTINTFSSDWDANFAFDDNVIIFASEQENQFPRLMFRCLYGFDKVEKTN